MNAPFCVSANPDIGANRVNVLQLYNTFTYSSSIILTVYFN